MTVNRRDILKTLAVGAAGLAGFQIFRRAQASDPHGQSAHNWAMVIDQARCVGCGYCTRSCQAHNDAPPEIQWNRVLEAGVYGEQQVFLPRPCQHCDHAPCVSVCPVKASYRRPDGIIMMDYDRCIGCRYCEVACPFGARAFNWREFTEENPVVPEWGVPEVPRRPRGVVEKCSFCAHRVDRGLEANLTPGVHADATPACVVVCPVGARMFGDLNDPDSNVSQALARTHHLRLREDMGLNQHVYYLPPDRKDIS